MMPTKFCTVCGGTPAPVNRPRLEQLRAGDVRVRAVVDVEQHGVRAFEDDPLARPRVARSAGARRRRRTAASAGRSRGTVSKTSFQSSGGASYSTFSTLFRSVTICADLLLELLLVHAGRRRGSRSCAASCRRRSGRCRAGWCRCRRLRLRLLARGVLLHVVGHHQVRLVADLQVLAA